MPALPGVMEVYLHSGVAGFSGNTTMGCTCNYHGWVVFVEGDALRFHLRDSARKKWFSPLSCLVPWWDRTRNRVGGRNPSVRLVRW